MAGRIRCGVLGAGWWATFAHIPALRDHPDAELAVIQNRDEGKARLVASDFGVPHAVTSWEELLAFPLDAVVIGSPPNLHYAQARAALERGLHVLVEKPMTMTAAEARHLVDLSARQGLQLLISCPFHYTRHAQTARALIQDGRLGDLRMISMLMTNPVDGLIRGSSSMPTHGTPYMQPAVSTYSDPEVAGGGQIYTQVSHAAAYLGFLTGVGPSQVFARFHNDGSRMDIYDVLNIRLENGCLVSIASTGATPQSRRDYQVWVFGTRAIMSMELWRGTLQLIPFDDSGAQEYERLSELEIYPERAPARNLIDCLSGREPNRSPGQLGLTSMEIVEAACESVRHGREVIIEHGEFSLNA
jgi:predicted dehydrogenase